MEANHPTKGQTMTEQNQEQTQEQVQAKRFVAEPGDLVITPAEETTEPQEERTTEAPKAHWRTVKAADLALMKAAISQESHAAVLEGTLTMDEARKLGREMGPDGPAGETAKASGKKAPKKSKTGTCIACLGETKGGRFHPGCDAKMFRIAREALAGERELTDEQHAYLESSGKMAKVVAKAEADKAKREAKIAAKAEAQRKKEGEAEAKKRNSAKSISDIRGPQPSDDELDALNSEDLDDQE